MSDVNAVVTRALQPGEETSEGKNTQGAVLWGKILIVVGSISGILPTIIDSLRQVPGIETSKTGTVTLAVLGVALAICGTIMKATATSSYNSSRGMIKAASVRDLDVVNAPVPPAL